MKLEKALLRAEHRGPRKPAWREEMSVEGESKAIREVKRTLSLFREDYTHTYYGLCWTIVEEKKTRYGDS